MPIDINGYTLSNSSGLKFNTSNTKIIAADYGISDPTLPGMLGSCTDGSGTYKVHPFPVNDVNLNIGSCWSTSTFKFTAPVTGVYYTSYGGIVGNGVATVGGGYFAVIVNGVSTAFSYKDVQTVWELHHIELLIKLVAGDTLAWAMNITPGPDSGGASGAYRANHNTVTIWLVG